MQSLLAPGHAVGARDERVAHRVRQIASAGARSVSGLDEDEREARSDTEPTNEPHGPSAYHDSACASVEARAVEERQVAEVSAGPFPARRARPRREAFADLQRLHLWLGLRPRLRFAHRRHRGVVIHDRSAPSHKQRNEHPHGSKGTPTCIASQL
jgi:hypothetical protein